MLSIKATPGPYQNAPPATAMFQRPMRTVIPSVNNRFHKLNQQLERKGESKGVNLEKLEIDDSVRLHDGQNWSIKGTIVDVLDHPRSYIVSTSKGTKVRRNRKQILLTKKTHLRDMTDTPMDVDLNYHLIDYPLLDVAIPDDQLNRPLIPTPLGEVLDEQNEQQLATQYIEEIEDISNSLIDLTLNDPPKETNEQTPVTTRSGRIVRTPSHLRDFHLN